MKVVVYSFGNLPQNAWDKGEVLHGFDGDNVGDEYESEQERVAALYASIDADVDDLEYMLSAHADGRLAVVGLTMTGCRFAVEV